MRATATASVLFAALLLGCAAGARSESKAVLTHGVASGEVTHDSIALWARCVGGNAVPVRLRGGGTEIDAVLRVGADSNWTGSVRVAGLRPATSYEYTIDCGAPAHGRFRTAPPPDAPASARIAWGGDIGGQNACRDAADGYSIFDRVAEANPDLFVALGDMIYADNACDEVGRYGNAQVPGPPAALDLETFREHWSYNRSDRHLQALTAQTPYVGIWDDHEIRNDGAASDDLRQGSDVHLFPLALRSFREYLPMPPPQGDPHRLYRALRWGRHAEIFILDTRQYRDRNDAPDLPGKAKTLLGKRQLEWLLRSLQQSNATWRIVVSSVPLSIPTGTGPGARDGWSNDGGNTGFESEATAILRYAAAHAMHNLVWITTDVHFATGFRYRPFEATPGFVLHELVSGPLNAGVFPRKDLDPTFRPERLFFWGPESFGDIRSYQEALGWFNFGLLDIDRSGTMTVSIVNGRGERVATHKLEP
jgi:alkaline phosphatase D